MLRALALAIALIFGQSAFAQEAGVQTPIVTIDAERLYAASIYGQRVEAEIATALADLAAENRRIEEALTSEERSLTNRRPTMEPSAFRAEAEAFDARVQDIRTAQDAKERTLRQASGEGQRAFFQVATPILGEIMRERGATVILERRSVFGSLDAIDVTDAALERINARLGDGGEGLPDVPPVDNGDGLPPQEGEGPGDPPQQGASD